MAANVTLNTSQRCITSMNSSHNYKFVKKHGDGLSTESLAELVFYVALSSSISKSVGHSQSERTAKTELDLLFAVHALSTHF